METDCANDDDADIVLFLCRLKYCIVLLCGHVVGQSSRMRILSVCLLDCLVGWLRTTETSERKMRNNT